LYDPGPLVEIIGGFPVFQLERIIAGRPPQAGLIFQQFDSLFLFQGLFPLVKDRGEVFQLYFAASVATSYGVPVLTAGRPAIYFPHWESPHLMRFCEHAFPVRPSANLAKVSRTADADGTSRGHWTAHRDGSRPAIILPQYRPQVIRLWLPSRTGGRPAHVIL